MVSLTFRQALAAEQALARLSQQAAPPKTNYRVARWLRLLRRELEHYVAEHNKLVAKHGHRVATTIVERQQGLPAEVTRVRPDALEAFLEEERQLLEVAFEVDYRPLTFAELESYQSFSANDVVQLGPCLEEVPE